MQGQDTQDCSGDDHLDSLREEARAARGTLARAKAAVSRAKEQGVARRGQRDSSIPDCLFQLQQYIAFLIQDLDKMEQQMI